MTSRETPLVEIARLLSVEAAARLQYEPPEVQITMLVGCRALVVSIEEQGVLDPIQLMKHLDAFVLTLPEDGELRG